MKEQLYPLTIYVHCSHHLGVWDMSSCVMLVTAPLTAHVNRWVIQLSSYCGVNELGSTV